MLKPYKICIVFAMVLAHIGCGRIATTTETRDLNRIPEHFSCITDRALADSIMAFILSVDEYDDSGCLYYKCIVFSTDKGKQYVSVRMSPELGLIDDKLTVVGSYMFMGKDYLFFCDKMPSCIDTREMDINKAIAIVGKGKFENLYYSDEVKKLEITFVYNNNIWTRTHFRALRMHKKTINDYNSAPNYNKDNIFSRFIIDEVLADSLYQYAFISKYNSKKDYGVILFEENEGCQSVSIVLSDSFCVPIRGPKRISVLGLCKEGGRVFLILCDSNIPPFIKIEAMNVIDAYMFIYTLSFTTVNVQVVNEQVYTQEGVKWESSKKECEYRINVPLKNTSLKM